LSLDFVLNYLNSEWRLRGLLFLFLLIFRIVNFRFNVLLVKLHLRFLNVKDLLASDDIPD
jgi:hypothetical protein